MSKIWLAMQTDCLYNRATHLFHVKFGPVGKMKKSVPVNDLRQILLKNRFVKDEEQKSSNAERPRYNLQGRRKKWPTTTKNPVIPSASIC